MNFNYAMTLIEQQGRVARFGVNLNRIGEQIEWFLVCYVGAFPSVLYFGEDRQRSISLYLIAVNEEITTPIDQ